MENLNQNPGELKFRTIIAMRTFFDHQAVDMANHFADLCVAANRKAAEEHKQSLEVLFQVALQHPEHLELKVADLFRLCSSVYQDREKDDSLGHLALEVLILLAERKLLDTESRLSLLRTIFEQLGTHLECEQCISAMERVCASSGTKFIAETLIDDIKESLGGNVPSAALETLYIFVKLGVQLTGGSIDDIISVLGSKNLLTQSDGSTALKILNEAAAMPAFEPKCSDALKICEIFTEPRNPNRVYAFKLMAKILISHRVDGGLDWCKKWLSGPPVEDPLEAKDEGRFLRFLIDCYSTQWYALTVTELVTVNRRLKEHIKKFNQKH